MLSILYEDNHIIVVIKPAGLESQSGKSFAPDMVSEIRKHLASHPQDIHKLTKETSTASKYPQPPYVGVIHRLDRPVSGIMVYAKNPKAAASLSTSLQQGKIEKWYQAVICGKPVDNNGTYVDYLKQDKKNNCSRIVDKSDPESKRAELEYKVLDCIQTEEKDPQYLSLVEIKLLTGRNHQIRVQFSGHGTPLLGDLKYNPAGPKVAGQRNVALCAWKLAFTHPGNKKKMEFTVKPQGTIFNKFNKISEDSPTSAGGGMNRQKQA